MGIEQPSCGYFIPSKQTTQQIVEAREQGTPQLDAYQAQHVVGEKLEGVLSGVSQEYGMKEPNSRKLILESTKQFSEDLQGKIQSTYFLREPNSKQAIDNLAAEFYNWIISEPEYRNWLGVEVIEKDAGSSVYLICLPPQLIPDEPPSR